LAQQRIAPVTQMLPAPQEDHVRDDAEAWGLNAALMGLEEGV
jgi:hypothetical protein